MSLLAFFESFLVALTVVIAIFTFKKLNDLNVSSSSYIRNETRESIPQFFKIAELTNGRLAMMGLFALVINYGFFGWIIPGIF